MNFQTLKLEIAKLAAEQVVLKNQKKTVHLVGERTVEPWKATIQHLHNREKLREMYMAYGLLRGKTQEQMELKPKSPINMERVNKLVEQYEKVVCTD